MARTWQRTLAILTALIATIALATACSSSKKSTTGSSSGPGPNQVFVQNFKFNPNTLTVAKGTKVTWVFKDSTSHTVTGDGGLSSSELNSGGTYAFTFNTAGTFNYICSIHPSMKASVTVQ